MSTQNVNPKYIFVSYSHVDNKIVLPMIQKLRQMGFQVWYDNRENLPPGSSWSPEIRNAVDHCYVFLAFFSKTYFKSDYCKYELQEAINNNLLIQTVYIDDCKLPRSYAVCDTTQNLYLGEYRSLNEFYAYLFSMDGMTDCLAPNASLDAIQLPNVKMGEKLNQSVRSFRHRNKKTILKIVAGVLTLAILGGVAVWKGPAVVESITSFITDKTNTEQETLYDVYENKQEDLPMFEGKKIEPVTQQVASSSPEDTRRYRYKTGEAGTYLFLPDQIPANQEVKIVITDYLDQVVADQRCNNEEGALVEDMPSGEEYKIQLISEPGVNFNLNVYSPKAKKDISSFAGANDFIQYTKQKNSYEYRASQSGLFYIHINDLTNDAKVRLNIYDANHNLLEDANCANQEGILIDLEKDAVYEIEVVHYDGFTPYTLGIEKPQETATITACKMVTDNISYKNQKNSYEFLAEKTGNYHFSISNMNAEQCINLQICDENDAEIRAESLHAGEGMNAWMDEGHTYHIYVSHNDGVGAYTLNLQEPQKSKSIGTGKTKGNMTFDGQYNEYRLTAKPGYVYNVSMTKMDEEWDSVKIYVRGKNIDTYCNGSEFLEFSVDEKHDVTIGIEQCEPLNGKENHYVFTVKKEKQED